MKLHWGERIALLVQERHAAVWLGFEKTLGEREKLSNRRRQSCPFPQTLLHSDNDVDEDIDDCEEDDLQDAFVPERAVVTSATLLITKVDLIMDVLALPHPSICIPTPKLLGLRIRTSQVKG